MHPYAKLEDEIATHNQQYPYAALQQRNQAFMESIQVPHILSNEIDVYHVLQELDERQPAPSSGQTRVAIVTGEAFILSRLPTLARHVDVILVVDIQEIIHQHSAFLWETLRTCPDRAGFLERYMNEDKNPVLQKRYILDRDHFYTEKGDVIHDKSFKGKVLNDERLFQFLTSGGSFLNDYFFLYNEQRYQACRHALSQLTYINCHLNWADPNSATQLKQRLTKVNAEVVFCHVSNVQDYDANRPARSLWDDSEPIAYRWNVKQSVQTLMGTKQGGAFNANSPVCIEVSACKNETGNRNLHSNLLQSMREYEQFYRQRERNMNQRMQSFYRDSTRKQMEKNENILSVHDMTSPIAHSTALNTLNSFIKASIPLAYHFIGYWQRDDKGNRQYDLDAVAIVAKEHIEQFNKVADALRKQGIVVDMQPLYEDSLTRFTIKNINHRALNDRIKNLKVIYTQHQVESTIQFQYMVWAFTQPDTYQDTTFATLQTYLKCVSQHHTQYIKLQNYIVLLEDFVQDISRWLQTIPANNHHAGLSIPRSHYESLNKSFYGSSNSMQIPKNKTLYITLTQFTMTVYMLAIADVQTLQHQQRLK